MSAVLWSNGRTVIFFRLLLFCYIFLCSLPVDAAARQTLSIQAPPSLVAHTVARHAIDDSLALLAKSFPSFEISLNRTNATILLLLPEIQVPTGTGATCKGVPDRAYSWRSRRQGARTVLQLTAATPEAVACGLYGLLQEQLGIRFVHPGQTSIPAHRQWPLKLLFTFSGQPRFLHQGFHLHTLHPMELTEQLHDPLWPGAFEDVAAYIDWLARNGQNSFQFFLLRGIDRKSWIPHAQRIVEYAHQRGIRCGVEISLAMLQQQAFQAITLLRPFPSYKHQVEQTLAWLFQVPWDFLTLESMMGEHLPLMSRLLPTAQKHLEQLVVEQYKRPLLYATHVISQNGGEKVRRPLCQSSGILIHTVMCYSASEPKAPVYGNQNQQFMRDAAEAECGTRETWYWPESSYWVGFDTSVPLLLLPYLDSRWDDMAVMQKIGVSGHLTFSTGWEWGYWLVDWSIARWSWVYADNGQKRSTSPLSRLVELFPDPVLAKQWQQALALQNRFLKDQELLGLMAASTPFAELPPPFDLPFQPEPAFSYSWLLKQADSAEVERIMKGPVANLKQYALLMENVTDSLNRRIRQLRRCGMMTDEQAGLADELVTALRVTSLRAHHRSLTLQALSIKMRGSLTEFYHSLEQARHIRGTAQELVKQREAHYRYPVDLLARKRRSLTSYPFGYLYPTASLFFWEREEEQAKHERFDPLFMNLWDIRRTLGLESLLLR